MSMKGLNLLSSTAIIISTHARYSTSLECAGMDNSQKTHGSGRNEKQFKG